MENGREFLFKTAWLALTAAGISLLAISFVPFSTVRGNLDALSGDGSADRYAPELHLRLQQTALAAAALLIVAAALAWRWREFLQKRLNRLQERFRDGLADLRRGAARLLKGQAILLVLIVIAATGLRLPYLHQPMRFDESYSYLQYSSFPWYVTISKYDDPNNHIFHNLLAGLSIRGLGAAPWAIRLPALLAGVLLVVASYLLAAAVGGKLAGHAAAVLVAASSPFIEYSTNGRGYTLVALFTVLSWLCAEQAAARRNLAAAAGLVLFGGLGLWTVPTMLLSLVMVWTWLAGRLWIDRQPLTAYLRLGGVVGATIVLAACLYLPALLASDLLGVLDVSQQTFLHAGYWRQLSNSLAEAQSLLFRDHNVLSGLALLALGAAGMVIGGRQGRGDLPLTILSLLACLAFLAARSLAPPARVWLFLLPLAYIWAGVGFAEVTRRINSSTVRFGWGAAAALVCVLVPVGSMIGSDTILKSTQTGAIADAEAIVKMLATVVEDDEPVIAVSPASSPLIYYAERQGLAIDHFNRPSQFDRAVVVVSRTTPQSVEGVLGQLEMEDEFAGASAHEVASYPSADVYRLDRER